MADPKLAAVSVRHVLSQPDMLKAFTGQFAEWSQSVRDQGRPTGQLQHVSVLSAAVINKLEAKQIAPESALLSVRDEDVLHSYRDKKSDVVPWEWYKSLPIHLLNPNAVLLDRSGKEAALLLIFDLPDNKSAKLVVKLDYELTVRGVDGMKQRIKSNILRSGRIEDVKGLMGFEVLDGAL